MTIQIIHPFHGFPSEARGVRASLVAGEVRCELLRIAPAAEAGAPVRVVWRIIEATIDPLDVERLGLPSLDCTPELQDRLSVWFRARHGMAVAERLYRAAAQPKMRKLNG